MKHAKDIARKPMTKKQVFFDELEKKLRDINEIRVLPDEHYTHSIELKLDTRPYQSGEFIDSKLLESIESDLMDYGFDLPHATSAPVYDLLVTLTFRE